jgi:DNA-binding MarR family transcriptional regulator
MKNIIDFHFEKPEDNTGYLLWQTTMIWQKNMNRALNELNITHTQFVIMAALAWLSKSEESITQKEIANHSNTDRMMVSKILRSLEKKQFIERKTHETDTRAKSVSLTKNGVQILQMALKIVENTDNDFFSTITDSEIFNMSLIQLINSNNV